MRAVTAMAALLAAQMLLPCVASAQRDCDGTGICRSFIPGENLPTIQAQQTFVWCWAATTQALFRYYGYDVSQQEIVARAFGTITVSTASPATMLRILNSNYTAADGRHFSVRTSRHFDSMSWLIGDPTTASLQTGLTSPEIFESLANERPVFYGDLNHAMLLVGAVHQGPVPLWGQSWVLDPTPVSPFPPGPITMPGGRAVGLRALQPVEMNAFFAALVQVSPM